VTARTLKDIRLLVGDEDDKEFLERLVHIANVVRLNGCVLLSTASQFGERSNQTFNSRACHLSELARDEG